MAELIVQWIKRIPQIAIDANLLFHRAQLAPLRVFRVTHTPACVGPRCELAKLIKTRYTFFLHYCPFYAYLGGLHHRMTSI